MTIDQLVSLILALIMFAIGLSIKLQDFKAILRRPSIFFIGLFSQMVLLPAMAFLIAYLSPLSPVLKVGLVVLSLCPGGNTSNYISYLLKANTALSVSLTTANGFLSLFSIPLVAHFALQFFLSESERIHLPFWETVWQILTVTLIPVILGALFKKHQASLSLKIEKPLRWITMVLLFFAFAILIFGSEENAVNFSREEIVLLIAFTFLLNIAGILIGFYFSKLLGTSNRNSITLSIEVGLQNTALALLITGSIIGVDEMMKPAIVYATYTFFTTLGFAWMMKKRTGNFKLLE